MIYKQYKPLVLRHNLKPLEEKYQIKITRNVTVMFLHVNGIESRVKNVANAICLFVMTMEKNPNHYCKDKLLNSSQCNLKSYNPSSRRSSQYKICIKKVKFPEILLHLQPIPDRDVKKTIWALSAEKTSWN